jgi:hypothetical protein
MSKKQDRRIFGMTSFELAILGILSFIAVVVIFGGFIYISSAGQPQGTQFFPTSVPSDPSGPSQPVESSDPVATSDLPPEAVFIPNDAPLPPNWKHYSTSRIELWLPPQFESVFVEPERQARIAFYRQQGYDFLAEDLEDATFDYRFWFNFPQPDTVLYKTSITVKTDILPTDTLDEYVDLAYGDGLQVFEFAGRENVDFADFEARRILMTSTLNELSIGVADYVITDGTNLWIIRCGSSLDEFYTWLPEFDRVVRSFRLVN